MKFGHKIEVHTIEATDKCRRQEDDVDDGEYLYYFVLLDVYQTEEGILEVVQTVETESSIIEERVDILDNHR